MLPSTPESAPVERLELTIPGRALLRRLGRDRRAQVAGVAIGLIATAAILGPFFTSYNPDRLATDMVGLSNASPSWAHPLGTDRASRDLLSRMLSGARVSLSVAALAVLLSATLGTAYGLVSGYAGGVVDTIMMRLLDSMLAIPRILIIIALATLWAKGPMDAPPSAQAVILIIGVTGWFGVSRLVRAETLATKHREYVAAARALGATGKRILVAHMLPNVIGPVIVSATLGIANVIAIEAGLSYIGYGIRAPQASWGTILKDAVDELGGSRWQAFIAGTAIVVTVLAFNLLADALRDALDARHPH